MPDLLAIEHADKAQDGDEAAARAGYMKALTAYSEARGLPVYHDANLSLRVSFGTVQGYRPRDAVEYLPFTTTDGIVQKNTGVAPFNAPAAELAAIRAHAFDGFAGPGADALPVNFLADLDIAGGNSGSPTLDRDGKLVGLVFDGAWEGVSAGWLFDPAVRHALDPCRRALHAVGDAPPRPRRQPAARNERRRAELRAVSDAPALRIAEFVIQPHQMAAGIACLGDPCRDPARALAVRRRALAAEPLATGLPPSPRLPRTTPKLRSCRYR